MGDPPLEGTAVTKTAIRLVAVQVLAWAMPTISPLYSAESVGTAHPASLMSSVAAVAGSESLRGAAQRQTVIVVVGAPGEPEYAAQFAKWAHLWEQACTRSNAEFMAVGLGGTSGEQQATGGEAPKAESAEAPDRTRIQELLSLQSRTDATSAVSALWLVLIGHGTYDGRTAKFNLRGPDLSAAELAEWLKPIRRPVAVIDTASSSAPFLKELSAPGRIVISATKSGFEQNYARFGQYLAEAIIDPKADLDKDGQTSLLEAFLTASHATAEFYAAAGRLATEHALLDDNGDALGTPAEWFRGIRPIQKARDDASLDGYHAHQLHLLCSATEAAMPPELRTRRDQLELQVMALRDAKATLPENEYFSKLEPLLQEIARIYEPAAPSPDRK
jgi:hypothetical protein